MARQSLNGVFAHLRKIVKNSDKVEWLKRHQSPAVFYTLWLALSGKPKWLLPEGTPPFKPYTGRPGAAPSDILRELRLLYLFLEGSGDHLTQLKREKKFQEMLENIDADDVELLVAIKDGKFEKSYRCPVKVVDEAFPGLLTAPFNNKFIR